MNISQIQMLAEGYLLPVALWLVMFSMGVGLLPRDFARIFESSRAFILGTGSMILLVPAVGTALALAFGPTPALTVGLILLATCPGGILSNLLTNLARGNVALSVSMSLFVSVIYIFTVPFTSSLALRIVYGESQALAIPMMDAVQGIMMVTVVPIAVGMICRLIVPTFALRVEPTIKTVSTIVLVLVFAMIVAQQWDVLRSSAGVILAIVVAMNVVNVGIALLVSRLGGLDRGERIAVVMEHIVRQEGTAIFVAVNLLGRSDMSLPMIVNTVLGMVIGIPAVAWLRTRFERENAEQQSLSTKAMETNI
ncbi:MAG: bile acid:sodium symporter family protein [Sphingopyxis sp.]|nr:bile acid:sodium symporter family protein [Sphingopyxis sp.]